MELIVAGGRLAVWAAASVVFVLFQFDSRSNWQQAGGTQGYDESVGDSLKARLQVLQRGTRL